MTTEQSQVIAIYPNAVIVKDIFVYNSDLANELRYILLAKLPKQLQHLRTNEAGQVEINMHYISTTILFDLHYLSKWDISPDICWRDGWNSILLNTAKKLESTI